MNVHADSFTARGDHDVCEDYALHTDTRLAVSDGCSAAEYSDVVARLLVHSAVRSPLLRELDPWSSTQVVEQVVLTARVLGLQNLDATLLLATYEDGRINFAIHGDGVAFWVERDGTIRYVSVEYLNSRPFYPYYHLGQQEDYLRAQGCIRDCRRVIRGTVDGQAFHGVSDYAGTEKDYRVCADVTLVGLASDGLNSFIHRGTGEPMPLEAVLRAITAIKSTKGAFLQRRMKTQLKQWSSDWYHYDDLGIACFAVDHDEETEDQ